MSLRIAGIVKESIVDGPGIRMVVFTQGCRHCCPGCHNPETHAIEGGYGMDVDEILAMAARNPLLDGITLSGGDPFEQAEQCAILAVKARKAGLNIMTYTGYTFEEIVKNAPGRKGWRELLEATDLLVDGRFVLARKSLMLKFRGSDNQRIIDVAESLKKGEVVPAALQGSAG